MKVNCWRNVNWRPLSEAAFTTRASVSMPGGRYRQHTQFPFYNDFKLYEMNYGECISYLKHISLIVCLRRSCQIFGRIKCFLLFFVGGAAVVLFSCVAVVVDFRLSLFYIT